MTIDLRFFALGAPRGKQRPRMARRGRRTITYTPQETLQYERTIREAFLLAALHDELPLTGPLWVDLIAIFPRTKALSFRYKNGTYKHGTSRILHTVKPDEDNIRKCVLDGIGDYIEGGDSRVVGGTTLKVYCSVDEKPGTLVRIRRFDELSEIEGIYDFRWAING